MAINDFGEKIGGAKKDLWRERGLQIEDLLNMNDAEKVTHIKKDNVWKKPDYQAMVDEGVSRRVVYFIKKVRDGAPTKPVLTYSDNTPERIAEKQEGYISFMRGLRDAVMDLRTEQDVLNFYEDYLVKKYITRTPGSRYVTVSDDAYGCIDNKLLNATRLNGFRRLDEEIQKKQFCFSEADKEKAAQEAFSKTFEIFEFDKDKVTFDTDYAGRLQGTVKLGYGSFFFYPQGEDAVSSSWNEGTFFIIRRGRIVVRNLESHEAAQNYVLDLYKATKEQANEQPSKSQRKRKTRFTPKQLKNIQRVGEDYRRGVPATGAKYMDVFGFKGGEFGNWMTENDRRASLDYGYDALVDMCKALNISVKDISLGGRLSIAFGARGSAGAAAHYEPLREVINLTKMHGAGSLAHEWAHALDDIFGKALNLGKTTQNFMSENTHKPQVPKAMKVLVDSLKYKTVSGEEVLAQQRADVEEYTKRIRSAVERQFPKSSMSEEQLKKLQRLTDTYIYNAKDCAEQFAVSVWTGDGNKDIDALSGFRKEITGRGWPKQLRIDFAHYQNNLRNKIEKVGTGRRVRTDFYNNSIHFDDIHSKTDHGYWQSTVEMFARAFACYVHDKIEGKSDYLVGHSESAVTMAYNKRSGEMEFLKAIPEGDERLVLNKCFDALIDELKNMNLLHDFEPEKIVAVDKKPSLLEQIQISKEKQNISLRESRSGQLEFDL